MIVIYAAFCGTGKSYLCKNFPDECIEFECWNYRNGNFPHNYINDIKKAVGNYKYIFISTNPIVLKQLHKEGFLIKLVYPKNKLKIEYFERFKKRGSYGDFVEAINKYWDIWLNELKNQNYCEHFMLGVNQYLQDVVGIHRHDRQ